MQTQAMKIALALAVISFVSMIPPAIAEDNPHKNWGYQMKSMDGMVSGDGTYMKFAPPYKYYNDPPPDEPSPNKDPQEDDQYHSDGPVQWDEDENDNDPQYDDGGYEAPE